MLIASLTAAFMCNSVFAFDEAEENALVQIGQYECYEKYGQYYTEIDGETYLVVSLGNDAAEEDDHGISPYSDDWQNGPVVDISDGSSYSSTINASKANAFTPIIQGSPTKGYRFAAVNLWGVNTYSITVHYYNSALGKWYDENKTITFIMEIQTSHVLFTGSTSQLVPKICVEFLKEGSTGTFPFTYRINQS